VVVETVFASSISGFSGAPVTHTIAFRSEFQRSVFAFRAPKSIQDRAGPVKVAKIEFFPAMAAMAAKAGGQIFESVNNPNRRRSFVL
jgi:hypothetical protein